MAQNSEGLKALRELTTLIDLKVIDSSNSSKRQTAITREPEESTDSESDDLREWSAPSADSLDVPALFKLLRKRDPEVLRFIYRSKWLRPLCIQETLTDDFIVDLVASGSARIGIREFASLWTKHRPSSSRPATAKTLVALRDIFNGVLSFEKERARGEEKDEDLSQIHAESILDAIEERIEFRAVCSTCNWFLCIAAGNALADLCCIENERLDFEAFVELLESCKTIEDHRSKTSCTVSSILLEVLLTQKSNDSMHTEWPILPYHHVTHAQVLDLAALWSIDTETEPHLVWVVLQALQTPLPPGWQVLRPLGSQQPLFRHAETKEERDDHPGTAYFFEVIQHERQQLEQLRKLSALNADYDPELVWIRFAYPYKFKDEDDNYYKAEVEYYYNFAKRIARGTAPDPECGFVMKDDNGFLMSKINESFQVRQNLDRGTFSNLAHKAHRARNLVYKSGRRDTGAPPETLVFKSWWNDNTAHIDKAIRRYMDIYFHVSSGNFQIIIQGAEKVYTLSHVMGKYGNLEAYDLFVGAKIDILGRRTTLMQGSSETVEWNESQATELLAIWENLYKELCKYEVSIQTKLSRNLDRNHRKGGHDLRAYMLDIRALGEKLATFRPKLAHKILQHTQVTILSK